MSLGFQVVGTWLLDELIDYKFGTAFFDKYNSICIYGEDIRYLDDTGLSSDDSNPL